MMLRSITILVASALSGCCVAPDSIRPELEHISHVTQHFGADRTNIGSESISLIVRWNFRAAYLDVGEGYNISPDHTQCPGGICGPREIFSARIGYTFDLTKR